jgi:hypothetical protein
VIGVGLVLSAIEARFLKFILLALVACFFSFAIQVSQSHVHPLVDSLFLLGRVWTVRMAWNISPFVAASLAAASAWFLLLLIRVYRRRTFFKGLVRI